MTFSRRKALDGKLIERLCLRLASPTHQPDEFGNFSSSPLSDNDDLASSWILARYVILTLYSIFLLSRSPVSFQPRHNPHDTSITRSIMFLLPLGLSLSLEMDWDRMFLSLFLWKYLFTATIRHVKQQRCPRLLGQSTGLSAVGHRQRPINRKP